MTEKQIARIRTKIRSTRAILSAEKRKYGWYDDSYGRRYLIGELYLSIADYKGAMRYFNWFEKEFEDDACFPDFLLYWTVALFQTNKLEKARTYALKTLYSNIYLLEVLCGKTPRYLSYKTWSNIDTLEFAEYVKPKCLKNISEDFLLWLKQFCASEEYEKALKKFVNKKK